MFDDGSVPLSNKVPVASYTRRGNGDYLEDRSRSAAPRTEKGTDALASGHIFDPMEQGKPVNVFSEDFPFSQSPPSTTAKQTHKIHVEIQKHLIEGTPEGRDILWAFNNASLHPPISAEFLAELDSSRIINNPRLRQDVNFECELRFRPNLDGAQGEQKRNSATQFWKALEAELHMLNFVQKARLHPQRSTDPTHWASVMRGSRKRLPDVFEAVRDILTTLVPDKDQAEIADRLDVHLIIQQIDNGVWDLVDLATWLGKVLKGHCAPMRDSLVDKMRNNIIQGAHQADQELTVRGLRLLFDLLEMMKLDLANHQIRILRPSLIADSINFLRRYHDIRIRLGRLDPDVSRVWLEQEHDALCSNQRARVTHLDALTHALLRDLVLNSGTASLTATFYLDLPQLEAIRADIHDMIRHRICGDVLSDLLSPGASPTELPKALTDLRTSLTAIVGTRALWTNRVKNIAAEIVRILLMLGRAATLYDADLIDLAERKLREDLEPSSPAFCTLAQNLLDRLLPKTKKCVDVHCKLSSTELQEALVPQLPSSPTRALGKGAICEPVDRGKSHDFDNEIVRRFSHVVVLHWQVWADRVYLAKANPDRALSFPAAPASHEPASPAIF